MLLVNLQDIWTKSSFKSAGRPLTLRSIFIAAVQMKLLLALSDLTELMPLHKYITTNLLLSFLYSLMLDAMIFGPDKLYYLCRISYHAPFSVCIFQIYLISKLVISAHFILFFRLFFQIAHIQNSLYVCGLLLVMQS